MTKEQQDLSWQCLPKEAREEIKKLFNKADITDNFTAMGVFLKIFGHHNLTSDTEPSELLFVEMNKVIDKYAELFWNRASYLDSSSEAMQCQACLDVLKSLFGDKCLPDKEPIRKIDAADSLIAMAKDEMDINDKEQFVQCEPKFKVGDKVYCKNIGRVLIVRRIITKHQKYELYDEHGYGCGFWEWDSPNLELYTEPKTKEPECIHPNDNNCKWKNICDHTQCYFDSIEPEIKDNSQQNSWNDDFKRFNECCNKIRKTLESLCNSFDKMKDCIDRL